MSTTKPKTTSKPTAEMHRRQREEGGMHMELIHDLERRGLYYIYAPAHPGGVAELGGIGEGAPDFHIIHQGRAIAVEMRPPGETLSSEQKECIGHLLRTETPVLVADSVRDAIAFINRQFGFE